MHEIIDDITAALYAFDEERAMSLILPNIDRIGAIPGVMPWINPVFDALERGDFLYAADVFAHEIHLLIIEK